MAIQAHLKTFSLVDVKVAPLTGETVGTLVDLPGARELSITLTTDAVELRGDGVVLSVIDQGSSLEWSLEEGGMSLDAMEVITGIQYADAGTTPNIVRTLEVKSTDNRPYFYLTGKSLSDDLAQDLHVQIFKAKATDNIEFSMQDNEFLTPTFGGQGVGRDSDKALLRFVQHETPADLAAPSA